MDSARFHSSKRPFAFADTSSDKKKFAALAAPSQSNATTAQTTPTGASQIARGARQKISTTNAAPNPSTAPRDWVKTTTAPSSNDKTNNAPRAFHDTASARLAAAAQHSGITGATAPATIFGVNPLGLKKGKSR